MSDSLKAPSVEEEVRQWLHFGPFFPLPVVVSLCHLMDFPWLLSQNVLIRCKVGHHGMLFIKGKLSKEIGMLSIVLCSKKEGAMSIKGFCPITSWEQLQISG